MQEIIIIQLVSLNKSLNLEKEGNILRVVKAHTKYQWVLNLNEVQTKPVEFQVE
jgi:hypothetical protein